MADYLKRAKEKVQAIADAAGAKAREIGESVSKIATGNDGMLGQAKGDLSGRQKQIDDAVDAATDPTKMANGGRVGRRPQRG